MANFLVRRMDSITFYNHFHNGDIFHSKAFVVDIMKKLPLGGEYQYLHRLHPNLLQDVDGLLGFPKNIEGMHEQSKFTKGWIDLQNNVVYVNTWVGCYHQDKNLKFTGECTLRFNYSMWEEIYFTLGRFFLKDIKLNEDVLSYLPSIDYSKFAIDRAVDVLKKEYEARVLFCNGSVWSDQCDYSGDMEPIINTLATKYPRVQFFITQEFSHELNYINSNVFYTGDIFRKSPDLNEISYLSTNCDLVVGRNSGPYCFCVTKENVFNPNITFYSFGKRKTDCFTHGLNTPTRFIWDEYESLDKTGNSIEETLKETLDAKKS